MFTRACVIFVIMQTQVGHLVFLNTSMSTECSILNISALGLLAQSVNFSTDFTIYKLLSLLYTRKEYFSNYGSKSFRPLELKGITFVVDCVRCVPIPG